MGMCSSSAAQPADDNVRELSASPKPAESQPIQSMTNIKPGECRFSGSITIGDEPKQAVNSTVGALKKDARGEIYLSMYLADRDLSLVLRIGADDKVVGDLQVRAELHRGQLGAESDKNDDDNVNGASASVQVVEMGKLRIIEDGSLHFPKAPIDGDVKLQGSVSWHVN